MTYSAPDVSEVAAAVHDWRTDFDLFDDDYVRDPFSVWSDVRDCPVLTSDRWGGSHMVIGYDAIMEAAANTSALTSTLGTSAAPTLDNHRDPNRPRSIINSDPPEHAPVRRVMLPTFAPAAVAQYEPTTTALCEKLCADIKSRLLKNPASDVDAAVDYSQQIPARVIGRILGVPESLTDQFIEWVRDILENGVKEPEKRLAAFGALNQYFEEQMADRRANPQDDLITTMVQANMDDGQPVPDRNIVGNLALLLVAGIDTTWSAIGSALWHLAQHPEQCARLVSEPDLWDTATEELLRCFAPVMMGRIALQDTSVAGCPVSEGRRVLLAFPAANRDPKAFDRANEVVLDRTHNRHFAFGSGIHRCAGSNLARMELRVALQVWLKHFPTFSLANPAAVTWAGGQVRGPRSVPVTIHL